MRVQLTVQRNIVDGWEVKNNGITEEFNTKYNAIKYARKLIGENDVELFINDNGNVKSFKIESPIKEHIEYSKDRKCWELYNENGIKGQHEFNTKIKAIRYARQQCEGHEAEIYVQEANGETHVFSNVG